MFKHYIQITGVIDEDEARLLIECGIKYIGFPLMAEVCTLENESIII